MIQDIQKEILRLKKENDICILAHSYVAHEILEIADFTGDSYALSVKAKTAPQKTVLMVGVRFMAETVKILSPKRPSCFHTLRRAVLWQSKWTRI